MSGGILGTLPQATGGGGILDSLTNTVTNNRDALMGLGMGLLSGQGWGAAGQSYLQGAQVDQRTRLLQQAQAEKVQKQQQLAQAAQKLGIDPALAQASPEVFAAIATKKLVPTDPTSDIREYEYAKRQGYVGSFADWQTKKATSAANGYGMTPLYLRDPNGNIVPGQLSHDGSVIASKLPDGYSYAPNVQTVDTGTGTALVARNGGGTLGTIGKDIRGKAAEEEIGKADGTVAAGAGSALAQADQTVQNIEDLKKHPGLDAGTGLGANLPSWASTHPLDKKDFNVRLAQLKGQTFLQAYAQLKGAGAITEVEGAKAEAAIGRLDPTQSKESFIQGLNDLETIVKAGAERIRQRAGRVGGATSVVPAAPGVPQGPAQQATSGIPSGSYNYVPGQGLVPAR